MSQFLYRRLLERGWLQPDGKAASTSPRGIVMRVEQEDEDTRYIVNPSGVSEDLEIISSKLNLAVMFTMSSDITNIILTRIGKTDSEITLSPNSITVPIVDSLSDISRDGAGVRRRDFCCFVREERVVLVWSNTADELMLRASDVESKLMSSVSIQYHDFVYTMINSLDLGDPNPPRLSECSIWKPVYKYCCQHALSTKHAQCFIDSNIHNPNASQGFKPRHH
jgi:hypothetical protein